MCQQIVQFCSNSAKPLLFAGGFVTFLSAIALGYIGCSSNALYQDIDTKVAENKSLSYYMELMAAGYLILLTAFTCFAAHYDQKHSIRALAILTTVNLILAIMAISMLQNGKDIEGLFGARLKQAQILYDFENKFPVPIDQTISVINETKVRSTRMVFSNELNSTNINLADTITEKPLNASEATQIWDRLQSRGCCGFKDYTAEWKSIYPKSCCAKPIEADGKQQCKEVDLAHQTPCLAIFSSLNLYLFAALALIAINNLYLAIVTGVNTYRTFSYNEASQSAYT